ncbi:MAG: multi-sensor signal transduction histidine kinase [Chloroflexi bacterium]|nr:multi-sensor signal transduction histidine kinase [Chloroflexota bacterium]
MSASSLNSAEEPLLATLALFAGMADAAQRSAAMHALAQHLRATDLILFIQDHELGVLLPAPGFPQTLPQGRLWRAFLAACAPNHIHRGDLPLPPTATMTPAMGITAADGSVLVVFGEQPSPGDIRVVGALLPLLAATLRSEQQAAAAMAQARVARASAAQAGEVAKALDHTQYALQRAVHEATLAHQATQAERDRLQQVLDVLPEAVVVADAQGHFLHANHAAHELLGVNISGLRAPLTEDETFVRYGTRHVDGSPLISQDTPLYRAVFHREAVHGAQLVVRHAGDGRDVPILANSAPLWDADGHSVGGVLVFQDISKIKDLERQKDEFLAIVSHDLNNPLTAILGHAQLLLRRARRLVGADDMKIMEGLTMISEAARRMTEQVAELLDGSRLEIGQPLDLNLAPTDLVPLLADLVSEYGDSSPRHAVQLETDCSTLSITADRARLYRALANLLANAIKYSPGGDVIILALAVEENGAGIWAVIQVSDHGIGIPAEEVPKVFERFYRASNVGRITGSGVGLAGVRQIVEHHGGSITMSSEPCVGTTVTVRLPLPNLQGGSVSTKQAQP